MLPPNTISAGFEEVLPALKPPSPETAQIRQMQVNAVSSLDVKLSLEELRFSIQTSLQVCGHATFLLLPCWTPPACKSVLLASHIHTDSGCASKHILSNLEHGINVRGVWFSLVTTFIRLWVAQTPWCSYKLTTPQDTEKSTLVTNLSCF